jgi:hypothetical protein
MSPLLASEHRISFKSKSLEVSSQTAWHMEEKYLRKESDVVVVVVMEILVL